MIIKFQAAELSFQLTTDDGDKVIDVNVGEYSGQLNTAQIPTVPQELVLVVQKVLSNLDALKQASE